MPKSLMSCTVALHRLQPVLKKKIIFGFPLASVDTLEPSISVRENSMLGTPAGIKGLASRTSSARIVMSFDAPSLSEILISIFSAAYSALGLVPDSTPSSDSFTQSGPDSFLYVYGALPPDTYCERSIGSTAFPIRSLMIESPLGSSTAKGFSLASLTSLSAAALSPAPGASAAVSA